MQPETPAAETPAPAPTSPSPAPDDVTPALAGADLVTRYCHVFDGVEQSDPPLSCRDMVELALPASRELLPDVISAEFRYATCGEVACPDAGTVRLVSPSGTLSIDVSRTASDEVHLSGFAPGPPPEPPEPFTSPPVDRPDLPLEMAHRKPLPWCGRTSVYAPADEPQRCFLRSIETGQPAELLETGSTLEGHPFIKLYRFTGVGAVMMSSREEPNVHSDGQWSHRTCGIYLHVEPGAFSCD